MIDPTTLKQKAIATLEDFKARDICCLDITSVTDLTDHLIVCSATSSRHAKTLSEQIKRTFKAILPHTPYAEGEAYGEWIVVDLHDVIVHIMLEDVRERYQLEQLWQTLLDESANTES